MNEDTIVAIFDTAAHADSAVRDLEASGIPSSAINTQASAAGTTMTTASAPREQGFWSSLFGGEPDHDTSVYDRSLESGAHVVTVRVSDDHVQTVMDILERNHPVDIDERAATYGLSPVDTTMEHEPMGTMTGLARNTAMRGNEETLQLSEEQVQVGKRLVNRGTTRIRRFVVETPVEEDVTLHSERVVVERRPVSGDARVIDAGFTDKTIEVTETDEEAVVAKTARVKEEILVRKDVKDRTETVRETVRREDVEITNDRLAETALAGPAGAMPPVRR